MVHMDESRKFMKWTKVDDLAYVSEDDQAEIYFKSYSNEIDEYNSWILDIAGADKEYLFLTSDDAKKAYEIYLETGVIDD